MHRTVGWLSMRVAAGVFFCAGSMANGQEDAPSSSVLDRLARTVGALKQWGPWEEQSEWIDRSLSRLWEQKGWTEESDRFALETAQQVAAIPPWQVFERLDRLMARTKERYGLSEAQAAGLKQSITTEMSALFARHAPTIVKQINEQVHLRLEAPDEEGLMKEIQGSVARWMRDTEPLHRDAMEAFGRVMASFESSLTPQQKRKFDADRGTLDKLMRYGEHLRSEGLAGRFDPQAWGVPREEFTEWLREVSLYGPGGARRGARAPGTDGAGVKPLPRWMAHDPSTWRYYVEDFSRRYALDAAQNKAATSILEELVERAERHLITQRQVLEKVSPAERPQHEAMKPVLGLFEILKNRLDGIPRREQKEAGEVPPAGRSVGRQP